MISAKFFGIGAGRGAGMAVCALLLLVASTRPAVAVGESKLGPRYVDPVHGYSLCPPAAAERDSGQGVKRLARWIKRDAGTGAILWLLTVRKETGAGAANMASLAKRLDTGLRKLPQVRVGKVAEVKVAGLPGVETVVTQGGKGWRWQRELWARRGPGDILVLSISGPLSSKDEMDKLLTLTAGSWKIMDPKELAELRQKSLQRGQSLLAGLTEAKLTQAAGGDDRWFLCRQAGKDMGFMHISSKVTRDGSGPGVEVRTTVRMDLPQGRRMSVQRVMSAAADRSKERWSETARLSSGGKVVRSMSEAGTFEAGLITCTLTTDGKPTTRKKPLEPTQARNYLPRAFALLLPKVADLSSPASYGFATYTAHANAFDLRTFAVIGAAKVTVAGRSQEAVQVTDQVAADAAPASMAVRADGSLLRMTNDSGIVIERSTRQAVLRRYPDAGK